MSDKFLRAIKDYSVLKVVSSGCFGTYYKVNHKTNGSTFIWKAIDYGWMSENDSKLLFSDVESMRNFTHPNLLQLFDVINHKSTLTAYLILEYCDGGNLSTLIKKCKDSSSFVNEPLIWKVIYQLSKVLQFYHLKLSKVTTLHCNVTARNVFLDGEGNAKLCAFHPRKELLNKYNMNIESDELLHFTCPEILFGEAYTNEANIWSLGCLAYELSTLNLPYSGVKLNMFKENIFQKRRAEIPLHYSRDLQKIIDMMLDIKNESRPSPEAILYHPLVVSHIAFDGLKQLSIESEKTTFIKKETFQVSSKISTQKECIKCKEWEGKLNILRQRENSVKSKENYLKEKERSLIRREKQISLLENFNVQKRIRKSLKIEEPIDSLNESSYSADPGDLSALPTMSRLNPHEIPIPSFVQKIKNRRSVHFREVNINSSNIEVPFKKVIKSRGKNIYMTHNKKATKWLENKRSWYNVSNEIPQNNTDVGVNKENEISHQNHSSQRKLRSIKSMKVCTKELSHGILETDFC